MGETYDEVIINRDNAIKALKKMKEIESKSKLYKCRIDKNTVVFCKNKDRFIDFKNL